MKTAKNTLANGLWLTVYGAEALNLIPNTEPLETPPAETGQIRGPPQALFTDSQNHSFTLINYR